MTGSAKAPDKLLLVEGRDDESVILHIRRRSEVSVSFAILDKGGVNNVIAAIFSEINAPQRKSVGIVVDANDDIMLRWRSVSDRLRTAGVAPPDRPDVSGTIIPGGHGKPRVGVWLMPDNRSPGELEDFVLRMVPESDPVWPLSKRYIAGIPENTRKFSSGKILKAELHAWLATRENPGPMGSAVAKRDLRIDGDLCRTFIDWLEHLFG